MSVKIRVPEPCHENWQEMSPREKGRFCSSCEKTVYDMTNLTDRQVLDLVGSKSNVCGRFKTTQLNRELSVFTPLKPKKSSWAITASLVVGLTFLASCNELVTKGEPNYLVGEIADTTEYIEDTLKSQVSNDSVLLNVDSNQVDIMVGKMEMNTVEPKECGVKPHLIPVPEDTMDFTMGDIIYIEDTTGNQTD